MSDRLILLPSGRLLNRLSGAQAKIRSMTSPGELNVAPFDCPTLQCLNVDASSIDAASPLELSNKWLSAFEASISNEDLGSLLALFNEHGYWKDVLTLTWDLRTIRGHPSIRRMLDARLAVTGLSAFRPIEDAIRGPAIIKPLPNLVFVRFCFEFETKHGKGTAVAFLVPTSNGGTWKAWSLLTRLDSLKAHPEKVRLSRVPEFYPNDVMLNAESLRLAFCVPVAHPTKAGRTDADAR